MSEAVPPPPPLPVFGLLAAGRLPQTDFVQLPPQAGDGAVRFACRVPRVREVNHLVVFLVGTMPLPADAEARIYIKFGSAAQDAGGVRALGAISNAKPSAVFKLGHAARPGGPSAGEADIGDDEEFGDLGIEVVPAAPQQPQSGPHASPGPGGTLARVQTGAAAGPNATLVENLAQFVLSYAMRAVDAATGEPVECIPLRAFQQWHERALRRFL